MENEMKIAHVFWSFTLGGAESMAVEMINKQCQNNKVILIVINDMVNDDLLKALNSDVEIILIKRPRGSRNPFYLVKVWLHFFIRNYDVFHCHNSNLIKILLGFKSKTLLTVHGVKSLLDDEKQPSKAINYYFNHYYKVIAISRSVQDFIRNEAQIEAQIINNGIDIPLIRQKQDFNFELFKIVQISRLNHTIKGQDVLIKAINYLVYKMMVTNIQLDLIGEGESHLYLKKLIEENFLEKHVNLLGIRSKTEVNNILQSYNLLVQPSIYEGFGLTVVEGMAANLPVLVSNVDGPMEIIENGLYGDCFKTGDYVDCAMKISHIMNNYHTLTSAERINQIRTYITSNFDIKGTAEKYLMEYKVICNK